MDLLLQFQQYAGTEQYQEFVKTLKGQSRISGRLTAWQEELLRDFQTHSQVPVPTDLEGILSLYRRQTLSLELLPAANPAPLLILREPVIRMFNWANQMASAGSHITIFSVKLATLPKETQINVADHAAPHDYPLLVDTILSELRDGANQFITIDNAGVFPFHGLSIDLLEFVYHDVDFKPRKYARAIRFVLADLACELACNRFIPIKRVGVPV